MNSPNRPPGRGRLFLIPVPLTDMDGLEQLPNRVVETVRTLNHFVVEEAKTARRILKEFAHPTPLASIHMAMLNEHTPEDKIAPLLEPLRAGFDVGLMSEAGCPAVADPGTRLVRLAHQQGFTVVPMIGPSSILLALMASGLEGQRFAFHGYLPKDTAKRRNCILQLENRSRIERETQIFIETPYRNTVLLTALLEALNPGSMLCVAQDLTSPRQLIHTASIAQWRHASRHSLDRKPAVFLFQAAC